MGNLGGVFSQENTPEGCTETHKSRFFPYKQVSGRNGDHELLRMTNAFILCEKFRKVMQRTEKEALTMVSDQYIFTDQWNGIMVTMDHMIMPLYHLF